MKKYMKIFQFRKIFQFMNLVNLDIYYYLTMNCLIKFFISEKSSIADNINHNFGEIRIDSYNYLPIEKY